MTVRITKPIQGGTVKAIASKYEAHRLLICAALSDCETFISCPQRSQDIDATARCLEAMGAVCRYEQDGFFITPVKMRNEELGIRNEGQAEGPTAQHDLDCGESGSTLRFLLPVCGAMGLKTAFHMGGRLPSRPLSPLNEEMESHGCTLSRGEPRPPGSVECSGVGSSPLLCEGRLRSGNYTLPGNISSQYVSGLLFSLPLLDGDSDLRVTGVLESRPYVDLTLDMLKLFGIKITEEESNEKDVVFRIAGGQSYVSPKNVRVGGDWSNAAFWLSAGAIGSESGVTCTGLDPDSKQGDRIIADILARFGAKVIINDNSVTVSPGTLRGIDIDAKDIPDLVPVLAAVASAAEGKTVIRNAGRLRYKESDRLNTAASSLSDLGADICETEDGLVISGKKKLAGGETSSFGDHRIAMAVAALSSACTGAVVIQDAEAVKKSYPDFFEDFCAALGGECCKEE